MERVRGLSLAGGRVLDWGAVPAVMAILNVTPDSFSDGGRWPDATAAADAALRMEDDGAAVIDIGGESTRPGAERISYGDELARVIPVIERIRRRSRIPISIDTTRSSVAAEALDAGADLVNDVSGLRNDEAMGSTVAGRGCPIILMHMRGEPRTMQQSIHFDDLIGEISGELQQRIDQGTAAGISPEKILVDPGIGFGKTHAHNLEILARCRDFTQLAPVVIGASRKKFIGELTGQPAGPQRAAGSLAAVAAAAAGGAALVRVHDVRETTDFLRVFSAIGAVW